MGNECDRPATDGDLAPNTPKARVKFADPRAKRNAADSVEQSPLGDFELVESPLKKQQDATDTLNPAQVPAPVPPCQSPAEEAQDAMPASNNPFIDVALHDERKIAEIASPTRGFSLDDEEPTPAEGSWPDLVGPFGAALDTPGADESDEKTPKRDGISAENPGKIFRYFGEKEQQEDEKVEFGPVLMVDGQKLIMPLTYEEDEPSSDEKEDLVVPPSLKRPATDPTLLDDLAIADAVRDSLKSQEEEVTIACPACTYRNHISLNVCEICRTELDPRVPRSAPVQFPNVDRLHQNRAPQRQMMTTNDWDAFVMRSALSRSARETGAALPRREKDAEALRQQEQEFDTWWNRTSREYQSQNAAPARQSNLTCSTVATPVDVSDEVQFAGIADIRDQGAARAARDSNFGEEEETYASHVARLEDDKNCAVQSETPTGNFQTLRGPGSWGSREDVPAQADNSDAPQVAEPWRGYFQYPLRREPVADQESSSPTVAILPNQNPAVARIEPVVARIGEEDHD